MAPSNLHWDKIGIPFTIQAGLKVHLWMNERIDRWERVDERMDGWVKEYMHRHVNQPRRVKRERV